MIERDHLRVADFYSWLGCQKIAATQLGCNQSTVSRRAGQVRHLATVKSSWEQADFLNLERRVHQCWRFSRACDLRLHAYRWSNHLLQSELPESWLLNPAEVSVTPANPLQLLQEHVIDALLAPWPLVQGLDRGCFAMIPVYFTPLVLLAPSGSALVREAGVSGSDIASLSRLGRLSFVPSQASDCSRHLDAQFFGPGEGQATGAPPTESRVDRPGLDDLASFQASAPSKRYWGTPLTPMIRPDLAVLSFPMPVQYGEFLVCLQQWHDHAEITHLRETIQQALAYQRRDGPGLETLAIA